MLRFLLCGVSFFYLSFASASAGLGVRCAEEATVSCTANDLKKVTDSIKINEPKENWKSTEMTFYHKKFEGRRSSSGNCFTHSDPTVAVNQKDKSKVGNIVVIFLDGKKRYALVTDTGNMENAANRKRSHKKTSKAIKRDLDTTKSLFGSLEKSDVGIIENLKWKTATTVKKILDDSDPDVHTDYEKVISCLKRINKENSEKEKGLSAQNLSEVKPVAAKQPAVKPIVTKPPAVKPVAVKPPAENPGMVEYFYLLKGSPSGTQPAILKNLNLNQK